MIEEEERGGGGVTDVESLVSSATEKLLEKEIL